MESWWAIFRNVFQEQARPRVTLEEPNSDAQGDFAMSLLNTNLKLALLLALSILGPAACNNQKAEQVEEEDATESQSDAAPTRDNRNTQSGDAAFIKIFPDGDILPTRGESATVSAPAATPTSSTAPDALTEAPASETSSPAAETQTPAPSTTLEETPASTPSQPAPTSPAEETPAPETQPAPEPIVDNEPAPAPAPEPIVVAEPAPAPAPAPAPSEDPMQKELEDYSRPILALNENTAAQIISVLPKENKSIVSIGKYSDFTPGAYMIQAKWTNDSKKVKVNVTSEEAKEKNCAIDHNATQGEWKTLGVFYLTKNAKIVITNGKNSNYSVKNELLLKPVIAENLTSPSKFKCLGGQIDGHGLVGFP
jgi:hypothetical protein